VIGISMKEGDYYDFYIPGDISFFSSSWSVEYSLEDSDVTWTKTGTNGEVYYNIHKHLDDGSPYHEYDIDLRMEDDMVTEITMRLSE
jgi:hypothetical protein